MTDTQVKSQTFVCFDTNILFRIVTQGQPGCELQHFEHIKSLVEAGNIVFLLPEAVLLEFRGLASRLEEDFAHHSKKIESALKEHLRREKDSKTRWNEFDDFAPFIESKALEWTQAKLNESQKRLANVQDWLAKLNALPLTQEVYFKVMRRSLEAKFPKRDSRPVGDCCIIETLADFFQTANGQLLLCTENLADFGVELHDGKNVIHPCFADDLPPCEVFTNLSALSAFCNEQKKVEEPKPEELQNALERETEKEEREVLSRESLLRGLRQHELDEAIRRAAEAYRMPKLDFQVANDARDILSANLIKAARQADQLQNVLDVAGFRDLARQAEQARNILPPGLMDIAKQANQLERLLKMTGIQDLARQAQDVQRQFVPDLAGVAGEYKNLLKSLGLPNVGQTAPHADKVEEGKATKEPAPGEGSEPAGKSGD
jgi:hypothetical protein